MFLAFQLQYLRFHRFHYVLHTSQQQLDIVVEYVESALFPIFWFDVSHQVLFHIFWFDVSHLFLSLARSIGFALKLNSGVQHF